MLPNASSGTGNGSEIFLVLVLGLILGRCPLRDPYLVFRK